MGEEGGEKRGGPICWLIAPFVNERRREKKEKKQEKN